MAGSSSMSQRSLSPRGSRPGKKKDESTHDFLFSVNQEISIKTKTYRISKRYISSGGSQTAAVFVRIYERFFDVHVISLTAWEVVSPMRVSAASKEVPKACF